MVAPVRGCVLLLTGPAASGKSSLASQLARRWGWQHVSEDDYWAGNGWGSGLRSTEQEVAVRQQVMRHLILACGTGRSAVLEFILYALPPNSLTAYETALTAADIPHTEIALKLSVAEILRRMEHRGRPQDLADLPARRQAAEHQVRMVDPMIMGSRRVLDTMYLTVDETCHRCQDQIERSLLGGGESTTS